MTASETTASETTTRERTASETTMESPLGPLRLVAEGDVLVAIDLGERTERDDRHPALERARAQLGEYFAGTRRTFELPLGARGTPFEAAVWAELAQIPFGETTSYGELAARLGRPSAARAVGGANGRNPLPIVVPCHRVVGASGALTGFGGGLDRKRWLLEHERAVSSVPPGR